MRYGIPNYRLPDSVLDDFQYRHLELKASTSAPIPPSARQSPSTTSSGTVQERLYRRWSLEGQRHAHQGRDAGQRGLRHRLSGQLQGFRLGDDIAVIGVGNSAMDCARTAIRNGARHVTCYARRDEECISASEHEVRYAKLEGRGLPLLQGSGGDP